MKKKLSSSSIWLERKLELIGPLHDLVFKGLKLPLNQPKGQSSLVMATLLCYSGTHASDVISETMLATARKEKAEIIGVNQTRY